MKFDAAGYMEKPGCVEVILCAGGEALEGKVAAKVQAAPAVKDRDYFQRLQAHASSFWLMVCSRLKHLMGSHWFVCYKIPTGLIRITY